MAETVFAGEQVIQLSLIKFLALLRLLYAIFARFSEDFFMRYGPCNTGYWNCKYEKPEELFAKEHS